MGSKRRLDPGEQVEAAVVRARAILEAKGMAAGAQLGATSVRPQVVHRLCSEGYEATDKGLRVPLDVQCDRVLASGNPVPLTEFKKRLKGASAKEVKELVAELVSTSKANVVLRGRQSCVAVAGERVVARDALKAIAEKLKATANWLDKARKDKARVTVLETDLLSELAALDALLGAPRSHQERAPSSRVAGDLRPATRDAPDMGEAVPLPLALRGAILALRDEDSRLAPIPAVSRRLRGRATAKQVVEVLLSEFQRGKLELRPEGGIGRLSPEERALCPVGAGGVPLSWVVLLEE